MTKSWSLLMYWFACSLGSDGGKASLGVGNGEVPSFSTPEFPRTRETPTPVGSLPTVKVDLKTAKLLRREDWGSGGGGGGNRRREEEEGSVLE